MSRRPFPPGAAAPARRRLVGTVPWLLWLIFLLWGGAPAFAHALFERSSPPPDAPLDRAPAEVRIWFTEPLEPGFSEVTVLDPRGRRVDRADGRIVPGDRRAMVVSLQPIPNGSYTVAWRALSAVDGHLTRGAFGLSVGVEAAPVTTPLPEEDTRVPAEAALRWLGYLGGVALMGTVVFRRLIVSRLPERLALEPIFLSRMEARQRRLLWVSWTALALSTAGTLALQGYTLAAESGRSLPSVTLGLLGTRHGQVWLARATMLGALFPVLLWLRSASPAVPSWTIIALSGLLLLTTSLTSHSAAAGNVWAVAADWIHQGAVAVWMGGLFNIVLALPGALRPLPHRQRGRLLAALIPRFSALALIAVGAFLLAGVYLSWVHIGSLAALRTTAHGRSLLVKLTLFVPLIALGAVNLLLIRPRLAAAVAARAKAPPERLGRRFARVVQLEALLGLLILLAAGVLTSVSPAREAFNRFLGTRPLSMEAAASDLTLSLDVVPARPGPNTFRVGLRHTRGGPAAGVERVDLRLTYLDQPLGTTLLRAEARDGVYAVRTAGVALEGRWQAEVVVRRTGRDDVRTAFRFIVTATAAAEIRAAPVATRSPNARLAALAVALAVGGLVASAIGVRRRTFRPIARRAFIVAGLGVALLSTLAAVRLFRPGIEQFLTIPNPYPPTEESLAIGEGIYRRQCQVCHGAEGRGDGPAAATLNPRPADLRVHMAAGHTDGQLYFWIANGMRGTAMPAFRRQLTDAERWHVVNFIKTFAPVSE